MEGVQLINEGGMGEVKYSHDKTHNCIPSSPVSAVFICVYICVFISIGYKYIPCLVGMATTTANTVNNSCIMRTPRLSTPISPTHTHPQVSGDHISILHFQILSFQKCWHFKKWHCTIGRLYRWIFPLTIIFWRCIQIIVSKVCFLLPSCILCCGWMYHSVFNHSHRMIL